MSSLIPEKARKAREKKEPEHDKAVPEPAVAPPKQRRRPALIGLGVALVALGGLGAAWLASSLSDTTTVIAIRQDVSRGQTIDQEDLTTAEISSDPALQPIAASEADTVLGKYASSDLVAGTLLTQEAVTENPQPGEGEAIVGVAVTPAQLPAETLRPGDTVKIVGTPKAGDAPPDAPMDGIEAEVVRTKVDEEGGQRVVDVVLPEQRADLLASRVATGRIAIVLQARAEEE